MSSTLRKKAYKKKSVKNVQYIIILSRVSFCKTQANSFFWLLSVGAAHGTPFYSQHARLTSIV